MYKSDEKYFGVINDTSEQMKILLKDNDISVLLPPEDILNGIVNDPSKAVADIENENESSDDKTDEKNETKVRKFSE